MRIVIVGDVHGRLDRLSRTLEGVAGSRPDLCLLAGDVGIDPPWPEPERRRHRRDHDDSVRAVLDLLAGTLGCPVLFVPGNHDLVDPLSVGESVNVDRRIVEARGLRIAGFGGAGPARFGFPYEWSEDEAERELEALLRDRRHPPDILLSHAPPADTALDRTMRGEHVGSRAVRRWIRRASPGLFVCGHIHESAGLETVEGVPCLNAGSLGEPYARELLWVVEWEGGPGAVRAHGPDATPEARTGGGGAASPRASAASKRGAS